METTHTQFISVGTLTHHVCVERELELESARSQPDSTEAHSDMEMAQDVSADARQPAHMNPQPSFGPMSSSTVFAYAAYNVLQQNESADSAPCATTLDRAR